MFRTDGTGYLLALRVADLFDPTADWTNRILQYGTIAQLRELLDSAATRASLSSREFALSATRRLITRDPIISGQRRGQILDALPTNKQLDRFVSDSHSYWVLAQEVDSLEQDYAARWTRLIQQVGEDTALSECQIDINLAGRLIGSHVRSSGLSHKWILNLCNYELKRKQSQSSMVDILAVADRLIQRGKEPVQFLLPLAERPRLDPRTGPPWLPREKFRARFEELFPGVGVPDSPGGGLQLELSAFDKYSAIKEASTLLARAEMRINVSSDKRRLDTAMKLGCTLAP